MTVKNIDIAFLHIEIIATMINITSSVSLHHVTRTGSETINNIVITSNSITVEYRSTDCTFLLTGSDHAVWRSQAFKCNIIYAITMVTSFTAFLMGG